MKSFVIFNVFIMNSSDIVARQRAALTCAFCEKLLLRCGTMACGHQACWPCLYTPTVTHCVHCHAEIIKDDAHTLDQTALFFLFCSAAFPAEVEALAEAEASSASASEYRKASAAMWRDQTLRQMALRVDRGLIPNGGAYIAALRKELANVTCAADVVVCQCTPRPLACVRQTINRMCVYLCPCATGDNDFPHCGFRRRVDE